MKLIDVLINKLNINKTIHHDGYDFRIYDNKVVVLKKFEMRRNDNHSIREMKISQSIDFFNLNAVKTIDELVSLISSEANKDFKNKYSKDYYLITKL
jgi:hypothetical protein